jgi:uncharacterized membrane protein
MRKIVLFFLPVLLLACGIFSPASRAEPTRRSLGQAAAATTTEPAVTEVTPTETLAATPTPAARGLSIVTLRPRDGKIADLLAAEVKKARELGQIPVVEFTADW